MDCIIPTSDGFKYFDMNKFVYKNYSEDVQISLDDKLIYHNENSNMLKRLVILITNKCNMNCKYCIANRGVYKTNIKNELPNLDEIKKLLHLLLDSYPDGIETIQFFGGEPLLEIGYLEELIICINEVFKNKKMVLPKFSIVTNGTLLSEKTNNFFIQNNIFVTISLDGLQSNHDKNRIFYDNTGTYNLIHRNIKLMDPSIKKIVEFSISNNCLNEKYLMDPEKIINSFIDMNFDGILTNIIYTKELEILLCASDKFENFLSKYINILLDFLFQVECPIYEFKITNIIISILTKKKIRNTCTAGISNLTINTNNELLACYLDDSVLINSDMDINGFKKNQNKYLEVIAPNECNSCWCNNLCSTWCRYMNNGNSIKSKCLYTKKLVTMILSRLYAEKNNCYSMKNLIKNIRLFTNMYVKT